MISTLLCLAPGLSLLSISSVSRFVNAVNIERPSKNWMSDMSGNGRTEGIKDDPEEGIVQDPLRFEQNEAVTIGVPEVNNNLSSPPGIDSINFAEESVPWKSGDPFLHPLPESNEDPWGTLYDFAKKYDLKMCADWRDEIEKHLVFAGLFSAAVTTFVVESYKSLDTDQDAIMVQLLTRITLQLDHIAVTNGPGSTSTVPAQLPLFPPPQTPTPLAIRINIAWFLSLTLSLTTVLIGTICLQWLREYERYGNMPHKDSMSLRQMRFEGLKVWHMPSIISSIPVLLQIALILFFVGIIDQLWTLQHVVAIPIIMAAGCLFMFMLATTLLPLLQCFYAQFSRSRFNIPQCPYKSPQSIAAHWLGRASLSPLLWVGAVILRYKQRRNGNDDVEAGNSPTIRVFSYLTAIKEVISVDNWYDYDTRWRSERESGESKYGVVTRSRAGDDLAAMTWSRKIFGTSYESLIALCHCFSNLKRHQQRAILEACNIKNMNWIRNDEIQEANDSLVKEIHCFYFFVHVSRTNKSVRSSLEHHYLDLYIRIRGTLKNPNLVDTGFNPFHIKFTRDHTTHLFGIMESFIKTKTNFGFDAGRFVLRILELQSDKTPTSTGYLIEQRLANFNQHLIDRLLQSRNSKSMIECLRYIFKLRLLDWPSMFEKYASFMIQYITLLCCAEDLTKVIKPSNEVTCAILDSWQAARMKVSTRGQTAGQPFSPSIEALVNEGILIAKSLVGEQPPPTSVVPDDIWWTGVINRK